MQLVMLRIAWENGGPGLASSKYAYVHPAPSVARAIRGTYQATPVTAVTASVDPDWPTRFLGLLHHKIRMEIANADSGQGNQLEWQKLEAAVDEAYQRDVQESGPFEINVDGRRSALDYVDEVKSRINIAP